MNCDKQQTKLNAKLTKNKQLSVYLILNTGKNTGNAHFRQIDEN